MLALLIPLNISPMIFGFHASSTYCYRLLLVFDGSVLWFCPHGKCVPHSSPDEENDTLVVLFCSVSFNMGQVLRTEDLVDKGKKEEAL